MFVLSTSANITSGIPPDLLAVGLMCEPTIGMSVSALLVLFGFRGLLELLPLAYITMYMVSVGIKALILAQFLSIQPKRLSNIWALNY